MKSVWHGISTLVAAMSLMMITVDSPVAENGYRIEEIKNGLYRFVSNRHRSVFLVTEEGIVVTDPMNTAAARWLKGELNQRFSVPVRYVIYSHNHSDHIYGAEVFDEPGTVFISHYLAKQDIVNTGANTVVPDLTFRERMSISLAGSEVQLRYHGPNDGRGSVSMLFQPQKVLFVVDWIVVGRMPWQKLWSYDIQGMLNSVDEALSLDFELFVGGHADVGGKQDVERYRAYLQSLYVAVIEGIHQGKTLAELKREISLPAYSDLKHYAEWLPLNVEGVHERLMEESGMSWRPDINR